MSSKRVRVCVHYGGSFSGGSYIGGVAELMKIPSSHNMLSELVGRVANILKADVDVFEYILWAIFDGRDRVMKMKIEDEDDLLELFRKQAEPNIYVELERRKNIQIPGTWESSGQPQSFTQLMASQGVFPSSFNVGGSAFYQGDFNSYPTGSSFQGAYPTSVPQAGNPWGSNVEATVHRSNDCHANATNDWGTQYDPPCVDVDEGNNVACDLENESGRPFVDDDDLGDDNDVGEDERNNDDVANEGAATDREATEMKLFKLFKAWLSEHTEQLRLLLGRMNIRSMTYLQQNETGVERANTEPRMWSLPVPPTISGSDRQLISLPPTQVELSLGAVFMSKEELICTLELYHMQQKVECRIPKSCTKKLTSICRYEGCAYKLCARANQNMWRITTLKLEHTCSRSLMHNRHRSAGSRVLGHIYAPTVAEDPLSLTTRGMIIQMKLQHGLSISYNVALRARHRAFEIVYGGHEESWRRVPGYLHMLQSSNPGTIVALDTDEQVFKHLFFALGASIEGFQRAGVPVIVIDGTHLKGRYKGILFVAATLDGNHNIFPLAVGIGDVECRMSWVWFLMELRKAYGCPNDLLIVSDRHESIRFAVPEVYPEAHHIFCYYHMTKQMKTFGKVVLDSFYSAAYSYRQDQFYRHMQCIKSHSTSAFQKLTEEIEPAAWARCCTPVKRYGFMTSNACESLNNKLLWARRLPVCSLLECVRATMEKWFANRRTAAESRRHPLTVWTQARLEPLYEEGRTFSVTTLGMHRYKVQQERRSFVVDLEAKTCECRVFETDLLPCSHASAAIR